LFGRIQRGSRARVFDEFDPAVAPLAAALLLGQREGIEPEVNDAFARTGTTHLLAISGLQLQALAFALLVAFRVVGLRRRLAYLLVGVGMCGYALLVGLAPSVVRSTIMTATFCLAALAHRLDRPANTLALAALGTLAVNPSFLFDVGCQLSFLAIGALVWLVPPACAGVRQLDMALRSRLFGPRSPLDDLERRLEPRWRTMVRRVGAGLVDGVIASTVVWLAALPLVALRFHLVSPIGILLNVPLIPLTSAALILGGLALALGVIWMPLGAPLAWAAGLLLSLTRAITLWGVAQPWGHRFVVGPPWGSVLVFYALLGLASFCSTTTRRPAESPAAGHLTRTSLWLLLAAWIAPGWLFWGIIGREPFLMTEFLAVGHGLAVLIQTPDGQSHLYDCGRLGDPAIGRRLIAPALWARGVSRIDTVFLSHADQDHYGGLTDLLDRFPIGAVLVPPGFASEANPLAMALVDQVRARGIALHSISAPRCWETAGVRFTLLHPPTGWHPETSDNARSLVLDIGFNGRHMLLTGDLEKLGLEELVALPPPQPPPDVFLAPHHGGQSANPDWLYEWAKPRRVVVSQRPSTSRAPDALSMIERQGIPLHRTWREGSIRLRWTSRGIVARGFLDESGARGETGQREGPQVAPTGSLTRAPARELAPASRSRTANTLRFAVALLGFALGAIAGLVLALVEFGAWVLVLPPRRLFDRAEPVWDAAGLGPRPAGERIEMRASDGTLQRARWYPADGSVMTGRTVLLLHGFAENSRKFEARRAAALIRLGWNVAGIDLRGFGESQGPYASYGGREAGDIRSWLDTVSERLARIDPSMRFEPVLWGRSMGAAIALRTAALDHRPVAMILESPLIDINATTALVLRKRHIPFPGLLAWIIIRRAGRLVGMPLDQPRSIECAALTDCLTLIVHGQNDTLVRATDASQLANAFSPPACWIEVPGAKHPDVVERGGDDLLARIAAFLDEAASGAEPNPAEATGEK
jgi:competence protein ComEC